MNTIDYNAELLLMPARGYFDEYPGHFWKNKLFIHGSNSLVKAYPCSDWLSDFMNDTVFYKCPSDMYD
jgi:hypothetical protein